MRDIKNSKVDFYIGDHAALFGLIAKYSEEALGDKGLETCGQGVILMGRERGLRSAKRCIANGDELPVLPGRFPENCGKSDCTVMNFST